MIRPQSNTEQGQRAVVGTKVRTRDDLVPENKEYQRKAWAKRKPGMIGEIVKHSNSHGLCFEVLHNNGSSGWYEPDEVDVLRQCPECLVLYGDDHPDDDCRTGTVEAVMGS
ncbi:hypothetical protein LCGC14_2876240 [marine sediment metagenome]|uniref:Uncharacterized protein n=1 Tax=marine sediment metagenome TaxID=412755 RepID=A0A0F9A9H6_9ZZZZ